MKLNPTLASVFACEPMTLFTQLLVPLFVRHVSSDYQHTVFLITNYYLILMLAYYHTYTTSVWCGRFGWFVVALHRSNGISVISRR